MRILHVVRDLDAASGGPSQSVPSLSNALAQLGSDSCIAFEDFGNLTNGIPSREDGDVCRAQCTRIALRRTAKFWKQRDFCSQLKAKLGDIDWDLIHLHGLWNGLNHYGAVYARDRKIPYVVSPRGMLSPWALNHKWLRKKLALIAYQRKDLQLADCLHATSEAEASRFRELGLRPRSATIANGTTFPPLTEPKCKPSRAKRQALFLSRIHPVKGLINLVRAWATVRPPDWECVICGPDEANHLAEVKQEILALNLEGTIRILPPASNDEKWKLFASSDLFILPSHSENFGIVIAEALACGVPVITTKNTPWEVLETDRSGWWVDDNVDGIVGAMKMAFNTSNSELQSMGVRGREYVVNNLSWLQQAEKMHELYLQVIADAKT